MKTRGYIKIELCLYELLFLIFKDDPEHTEIVLMYKNTTLWRYVFRNKDNYFYDVFLLHERVHGAPSKLSFPDEGPDGKVKCRRIEIVPNSSYKYRQMREENSHDN